MDVRHARRCFMRENDTKVITAMRRESPVYKGFQRFSALEVIRFFAMFSDGYEGKIVQNVKRIVISDDEVIFHLKEGGAYRWQRQ